MALIYRFETCTLDVERRELRRDGVLRRLEPQVFDLLHYLIENRGRVVSRDDIFDTVWRGRIVSDAVLSTRLNAVRAAVGDSGQEQRLIRTLPRRGIRFVAAVHDDSAWAPESPVRRLAKALQDAPSLAVIPFVNSAGNPRGAFLADALTDELVAALWRHDWLQVLAVERPDDAPSIPIRAIAGPSARYVLQGSVRQSGAAARISVRLIEAHSGCALWAEGFDLDAIAGDTRPIAGKVQQQTADHIFAAEALRGRLASAQDNGVWSTIVAALSLINTREKSKVEIAERLLRQAVARDPRCAPAYALLSFIVTLRVHLAWRSRAASQRQALALARQAIAADADDAWAHLALGYATLQVCNQPEEAIEVLQRALQLNPALSVAHYFAALSSAYAGRAGDAFAHADMAERLHLHDLLARGNVGAYEIVRGTSSFVAGCHTEGIAYAQAALRKNSRHVPAYRQLVINAASAGESALAQSALRTMRRLTSGTETFIRESATAWQSPHMYQKMVEAYRVAGLRLAG